MFVNFQSEIAKKIVGTYSLFEMKRCGACPTVSNLIPDHAIFLKCFHFRDFVEIKLKNFAGEAWYINSPDVIVVSKSQKLTKSVPSQQGGGEAITFRCKFSTARNIAIS